MAQNAARARSRIVQELDRVARWIATLRNEARPEELEAAGDNTPLSESADTSQVVEAREVGTRILDHLVERAVDLRRALRRVEDGTYGVCGRCRKPIPPMRLEALPEAAYCRECEIRDESQRHVRHPVEPGWVEATLSPRQDGAD